jgi:DNA-binding response OmpR family regulator
MADSGEALQVLLEKTNLTSLLIAVTDMALNNHLRNEILTVFPDFTIVQAFDGFDMGLKLAGEKPGLIILDGELPGIELKKLLPLLKGDFVYGKPFIFILGESSDHTAIRDSVDGFLAKPPNMDDLLKTIKDLERLAEASA